MKPHNHRSLTARSGSVRSGIFVVAAVLSANVARADKPVVYQEAFAGQKGAAIAAKVVGNALKDKVELSTDKAVLPKAEASIAGAEVKGKGLFVTVKGTKTAKVEKLFYAEAGGKIPAAAFEKLAADIAPAVVSAIGHPLDAPAPTETAVAAKTPGKDQPWESPFPPSPPSAPATPAAPAAPTPPAAPETPAVPAVPATPAAPATPEVPAVPAAPAAPEVPAPVAVLDGDRHPHPDHMMLRQPWAPGFESSASFMLAGRDFHINDTDKGSFTSTVTPGLRIDATAFPHTRRGGDASWLHRALGGVGIGVTTDFVFWSDTGLSNCPAGGTCSVGTSEYRIEAGIRWRYSFTNGELSPQLLFDGQYGTHQFVIEKKQAPAPSKQLIDAASPDVNYQYITLGLGLRLPIVARFAIDAAFRYHAMLDQGYIQSPAEYGAYGKGGGWGLRADLNLRARLVGPLHLRVGGFYERFSLSFVAPTDGARLPATAPCPCAATGATDQYYGALVGLEYRR